MSNQTKDFGRRNLRARPANVEIFLRLVELFVSLFAQKVSWTLAKMLMPSWLMTFRFVRRARLDAWYWNKTACYSSEGTASQLPVADLEPPSPFMDDSLLGLPLRIQECLILNGAFENQSIKMGVNDMRSNL